MPKLLAPPKENLDDSARIEQLVLGALLINPRHVDAYLAELTPDLFSIERNRHILAAMHTLHNGGVQIDRVVVARILQARDQLEPIGGFSYLVSLDDELPQVHNLEGYIRILEDQSLRKKALAVLETSMNAIYAQKSDALTVMETTQAALSNVRDGIKRESALCTLQESIERLPNGANEFFSPHLYAGSIATPWAELNQHFLGFRSKHLYIIGARPSHGKTILLCQLAQFAAEHFLKANSGKYAALFTLEQGREELFQRIMCANAGVNFQQFLIGDLNPHQVRSLQAAASYLNSLPLIIDESVGHSPGTLNSAISRSYRSRPIGMAFVDYLQLMAPDRSSDNRTTEVSSISRGLKLLSGEQEIPVVAASQLTRKSEVEDKRPNRADLRESGGIEQDASFVGLLWNVTKTAQYRQNPNKFPKGHSELIIAKQRNGPETIINLQFEGHFVRFSSPEPQSPQKQPPPQRLWNEDDDSDDAIGL